MSEKSKLYFGITIGHDSGISIWDKEKNVAYCLKIDTFNKEKHSQRLWQSIINAEKHARLSVSEMDFDAASFMFSLETSPVYMRNQMLSGSDNFGAFMDSVHQYILDNFKIENDYEKVIVNFTDSTFGTSIQDPETFAKGKEYIMNTLPLGKKPTKQSLHHNNHAMCGYWQSPFCMDGTPVSIITYDGGGDNVSFTFSVVNGKGDVMKQINFPFCWGYLYPSFDHNQFPGILSPKTDRLDVAGKLMGYSAYGKRFEKTHPQELKIAVNLIKKLAMFFEHKPPTYAIHEFPNFEERDHSEWRKEFRRIKSDTWPRYEEQYLPLIWQTFGGKKNPILRGDAAEFTAYAIQRAIEESMISLIKDLFMTDIKRCNNNLIISGGCALNVLVNERIKKEFPFINVYVPPNPADDGLVIGAMFHYLKNEITQPLKTEGPPITDLDKLSTHNPVLSSIDEMISYLRNEKIIGLLQGPMEIGPRALGFRSILCDPTFPDMKDTLNAKVKFREWYRPFAPACRLEDAPKYFESVYFDNMETMSFTVDVKKPYRSMMKSITHVDNTARLQTVTRESNPFFYDLLTEWDGVLLNTSFNVQGKPILNSIAEALAVLNNSGLDAFFVVQDDQVYKFE